VDTVEAAGSVAAMTDGAVIAGRVVQVHSIQQACRVLKEKVKGGAQKADDMTPSDTAFSKSAGSHHRFSQNKLSESPIDVNQVSRDSFAAAGNTTAGTAMNSNDAMVLRARKQATEEMVDLAATSRTKKKAMVVTRCSLNANRPIPVSSTTWPAPEYFSGIF
jgi:hypothetical protein